MTRAGWWVLAGAAALVILFVYLQHQRCPRCQKRGQAMIRTFGNWLMGFGKSLVERNGS
jgi:hypothetical protein